MCAQREHSALQPLHLESFLLFCGSQAASCLTALEVCAEILEYLEKRKVPWLPLFQLTETGKKPTET